MNDISRSRQDPLTMFNLRAQVMVNPLLILPDQSIYCWGRCLAYFELTPSLLSGLSKERFENPADGWQKMPG